jgi:hypothetical protein
MAICPKCRKIINTARFFLVFPVINPRAYIKCKFCKSELKAKYWIIPTFIYFFFVFGFLFSIRYLSHLFGVSALILFIIWVSTGVFGPIIYSVFEFEELNLE